MSIQNVCTFLGHSLYIRNVINFGRSRTVFTTCNSPIFVTVQGWTSPWKLAKRTHRCLLTSFDIFCSYWTLLGSDHGWWLRPKWPTVELVHFSNHGRVSSIGSWRPMFCCHGTESGDVRVIMWSNFVTNWITSLTSAKCNSWQRQSLG